MKKLVASLALLSVIGSSTVLASNVADGFDWPAGFSTDNAETQQLQANRYTGFNWPEGRSFDGDITPSSHADIAYGFNWPEGS